MQFIVGNAFYKDMLNSNKLMTITTPVAVA